MSTSSQDDLEVAPDAASPPPGTVSLSFVTDMVPGEGEDAEPIVMVGYERTLLGAFDGMGGAGGTAYDSPLGRHSGAWFASRLARAVVQGHMPELVDGSREFDPVAVAGALHDRLEDALVARLEELKPPPSAIRSKLLKALPTTMALAYLVRSPEDRGAYTCHCFWAGDSRTYVITPGEGAQQLTVDDLRTKHDAMANLLDDGMLENHLSASNPFRINHSSVELRAPFMALCCTDGCFQYVPTPMHFEHLVLSTLADAASPDAWQQALRAATLKITGDDAAIGLVAVGGTFEEIKALYRPRLDELRARYIEPLDQVEQELRAAQRHAEELKEQRATRRTELWASYKAGYERHLPGAPADPAPEEA